MLRPLELGRMADSQPDSEPGVIYGIIRATKQEREAGKTHRVIVSKQ